MIGSLKKKLDDMEITVPLMLALFYFMIVALVITGVLD